MIDNTTCGAELRNYLTPVCNVLHAWSIYCKNPGNPKYHAMVSESMQMLDYCMADFDDMCKYLDRYEFNREDYVKMINEK